MIKLFFGDCLDILKELHKEHTKGFIDISYIYYLYNSYLTQKCNLPRYFILNVEL